MAVTDLPATPVDGNVATRIVTAIADTTAPKLTEINAVSSIDISCYLTQNGDTSGDQASIPDPRACSTQDFEQPGKITRGLSLTYIENSGSTSTNKAADTLVPGTILYIVERRGKTWDAPFAVGDKVDVWPVKPGIQLPVREAGQVLRVTQKQFVVGPVRPQVAVVA